MWGQSENSGAVRQDSHANLLLYIEADWYAVSSSFTRQTVDTPLPVIFAVFLTDCAALS